MKEQLILKNLIKYWKRAYSFAMDEKEPSFYLSSRKWQQRYPLFFPALYFLTGMFSFLFFLQTLLILPFIFYWAWRFMPKQLLLFFLGVGFGSFQLVEPAHELVHGWATVKILKMQQGKWGRNVVGSGFVLMKDESNKTIAKNVSCFFSAKAIAEGAASVSGRAKLIKEQRGWKLQFDKIVTYRSAFYQKWIQRIKKAACWQISRTFPSSKSKQFFQASFLGIPAKAWLRLQFQRAGLLHLLAISGFHFGLICLTLHFVCRRWLASEKLAWLQLIVMSCYFILLDNSASVLRAYLLVVIFYLGLLFCKKSNPLNSLCCAFFVEVLIHPGSIVQLGMQLSYLITCSLLCFYPSLSKALLSSLPTKLHGMDRWLGAILTLFYKALALTICVHLVTLPLLLYSFQELNLLGLIYNFFMPQLLSFCMIAALFSLALPFFSQVVDLATTFILDLIEYIPQRLALKLQLPFPAMGLAPWFFALLVLFVYQEQLLSRPKSAPFL